MNTLSAAEAFSCLKTQHQLTDVIVDDVFFFTEIQNSDFEVPFDLLFKNCIFNKKFGAFSGYYRGKIIFQSCIFKGEFVLNNIFTYQKFCIEHCHFEQAVDLSCGGFYNTVEIHDNIFDHFADFSDQDIQGQSIFINNQFNSGTNLMHPLGGPNGAHFTLRPHLEGNIGLERYERPLRSETDIADAG